LIGVAGGASDVRFGVDDSRWHRTGDHDDLAQLGDLLWETLGDGARVALAVQPAAMFDRVDAGGNCELNPRCPVRVSRNSHAMFVGALGQRANLLQVELRNTDGSSGRERATRKYHLYKVGPLVYQLVDRPAGFGGAPDGQAECGEVTGRHGDGTPGDKKSRPGRRGQVIADLLRALSAAPEVAGGRDSCGQDGGGSPSPSGCGDLQELFVGDGGEVFSMSQAQMCMGVDEPRKQRFIAIIVD
jgi:hypothetical protein